MRRRARIDENQPEIVEALRSAGASVESLAWLGKGCPDLLVGFNGANFLMEVKWPLGSPSQRELTDAQKKWHKTWRGQLFIVTSAREALDVLKQGSPLEDPFERAAKEMTSERPYIEPK